MNKLSECKINDKFIIKYIEGTEEQKRHLQNIGFVPTTIISIINIINDNMIVQVFDSRIGIDSKISSNIYGKVLKKEHSKEKIIVKRK